jgi:hypothetical protein
MMGDGGVAQLASLVDCDDTSAVIAEARRVFSFRHDETSWGAIEAAAGDILDLFAGKFPGYHACDTEYHDIHHTTMVFLTTARIADGLGFGREPFPADLSRDLYVAALCHDVGYIRAIDEEGGTGARFTSVHVRRSADFVLKYAHRWGLPEASASRIFRLVNATGLRGEFGEQAWDGSREREAGMVLASADLVGQMSDRKYLEKLLFLYNEFKEAGFPGYDTEFDMLRKTMDFYKLTIERLDVELEGVRSLARKFFAERHGIDRDLYTEAIDHQMNYLRNILDDESTNFRKKLKRMDLELSQPRTA